MKHILIKKQHLLQLCFKSSRVSEWLEDEEREDATVDIITTNHLQFVDIRRRLTNRFNVNYKEDYRLRENVTKFRQ